MIIFALVGVVVILGALWHDFREWRRGSADTDTNAEKAIMIQLITATSQTT